MQGYLAIQRNVIRFCVACIVLFSSTAQAETYWLDSRFDDSQPHYPTMEEACVSGELERRLDGYRAKSALPHRYAAVSVGPYLDGEAMCRGQLQRRQFNSWLPVEIVNTFVYGPRGARPPCPLDGLADPDTGQCGMPKCDSNCPSDGGNRSNPIASATGNKRQQETDYIGAGAFPLQFVRVYNSHRVPDSRALPVGIGWTHNYAAKLDPVTNATGSITRIRAHRPNGAIQTFSPINGEWTAGADVPERLTVILSAGSLVSATYRRADDSVETYDELGRLSSITSRDGLVQTLSYAVGSGTSPYVQRVTDPQGRWLVFGYTDGRLTSLTDGTGAVITYAYTGDDLTSVTYPEPLSGSAKRIYHYSEAGQTGGITQPHLLTGITDEDGNRYASWTYDAHRRGVLSVHGPYAGGSADRVELRFNADGSTTITDSLGKVRNYTFGVDHSVARLASLDAPCDHCVNVAAARTYDSNGYPASRTDFRGNVARYTYNARGLQTERIEAANDGGGSKRTTQTDWHATFRQPTERRIYDAEGVLAAETSFIYNNRGQLLTETRKDPSTSGSRTTTTTYCESADVSDGTCPLVGLPISIKGPRTDISDTTTYVYHQTDHSDCGAAQAACAYRRGDLWKVIDPLGRTTTFPSYDNAGRRLSSIDPNGVETSYEYHPRGWLTAEKVRSPDDSTERDDRITRTTYRPTGLVERITQPDGDYLTFSYDAAQRLARLTDNSGGFIAYTLDGAGNRIAEESRDSAQTLQRSLSRIYDLNGRLATVADASSIPTDFGYDDNGNINSITDAFDRTERREYDAQNRLRQTTQDVDDIGAVTRYLYNPLNRLVLVTDPKGLHTRYTYNALGDLLQLSSPDTGTTRYSYDSAGNRDGLTDSRGQTVSYRYDALKRLTQIAPDGAPALDASYLYDAAPSECETGETFASGYLSQIVDASGTTGYCYDRFGHIVRKIQVVDGHSFAVRYAYSLGGKLQVITYPDGTLVDYVRDPEGRISEIGVTSPGASRQVLLSGVTYYPFGPAAGWSYGNGRTLVRAHDRNYRTVALSDVDGDGLDAGYAYDAVGNLTGLHTAGHELPALATFDYDALNRLVAFRDGATGTAIERYDYDATGNRTSFTNAGGTNGYAYPADSHRLHSVDGVSRKYDAVGNTASIDGTDREFVFDPFNRLIQVKQSGQAIQQYAYNGRGERVRSYLGTTTTTYSVHDESGQWLGDYDATGTPIQQVIWLGDLPVGVLVGTAASSNRLHYIEPDQLGAPRAVIEAGRNVAVWTWDLKSEAFGSDTPNEDPDADGTPFAFNMRFAGQRFDPYSGLHHNYAREYEPSTGRYLQSDPVGLAGGISTYSYVESNPLLYTDSTGQGKDQACMASCTVSGSVIGGGIGYAGGGIAGGVGGGAGCTLFAPGVGTVACGAGGAAAGSSAGGLAGSIVGSSLGYLTGLAICPSDEDNTDECYRRYDGEAMACDIWRGRGPSKDPDRWYRACMTRAADRRNLCVANKAQTGGEPDEWSDRDLR